MPIGPAPTVISVTAAGGKYYMDGVEQGFVDLDPGTTYVFDVSDGSMAYHPLAFSTTEDGTHGGGAEYADADYSVAADGTVTLVVDDSTPVLYYYCEAHSGMGGVAALEVPAEPIVDTRVGELLTNGDFDAGTTGMSGNALNVVDGVSVANVAEAGAAYNVNLSGALELVPGADYTVVDLRHAVPRAVTWSRVSVTLLVLIITTP